MKTGPNKFKLEERKSITKLMKLKEYSNIQASKVTGKKRNIK